MEDNNNQIYQTESMTDLIVVLTKIYNDEFQGVFQYTTAHKVINALATMGCLSDDVAQKISIQMWEHLTDELSHSYVIAQCLAQLNAFVPTDLSSVARNGNEPNAALAKTPAQLFKSLIDSEKSAIVVYSEAIKFIEELCVENDFYCIILMDIKNSLKQNLSKEIEHKMDLEKLYDYICCLYM